MFAPHDTIAFFNDRANRFKELAQAFRVSGDKERAQAADSFAQVIQQKIDVLEKLSDELQAIEKQAEAWDSDNSDAIDLAWEDEEALELAHIFIGRNAAKGRESLKFGVKPIS